jgi:hypothetical protein
VRGHHFDFWWGGATLLSFLLRGFAGPRPKLLLDGLRRSHAVGQQAESKSNAREGG